MATSKLLQTPKIIEIIGSTLRIAHPQIKGNVASALAAPLAAAGTAASLYDNNGLKDDDFFIVGSVGDRETEECDVNGAVTRGQSITFTNTLKFAHQIDSPITKINERGIKIYGAATIGGSGTLITSVDAITSPIADTVMIQWDKDYTEYTLISTDTTYAFYFVKFADGTTDSTASTYVPSTGVAYNKIEPLIKQAMDLANVRLDNKKLTRDMYVNWANDCQDAVRQFTYQDPSTGRYVQKDWSFEITLDEGIALVEGEDRYLLSTLTSAMKYPNTDKSIFAIKIGHEKPMQKMAIKDFDILRQGVAKTYANGTAAIADTSITVDSTANFADTGSLVVKTNKLTYTGKTATTFTGIPASGSGSITATIDDNTAVWQNIQSGQPEGWVIFDGYIYFNRPPNADFAGYTITVRYLKELTRITSVSDGTAIPFTNAVTQYLAAMTHYRLGDKDEGAEWMARFTKQVLANALADYIPMLDEWNYYTFTDSIYEGVTNTDQQPYYNF